MHLSLPDSLNRLGPMATPVGRTLWRREFPMGNEKMAFAACLESDGETLRAAVEQIDSLSHPERAKAIYQADWKAEAGAWVFQRAALDGRPLSEQPAITAFEDYLQALAVDPQYEAPEPPEVSPRRRLTLG